LRRFQTDYYEDGVLNAILTWPEDHPKIFNYLQPEHFEPGLRQKVYKTLYRVYQKNRENPISNVAMITEICSVLKDEKTNWNFWIKKLQEESPYPTDLNFYIQNIKKQYNRRYLATVSNKAKQQIEDGEPAQLVADKLKNKLLNMEAEAITKGPINAFDVIGDCLEMIEEGEGKITGIPTYFKKVDQYIIGMRPGDLIVVAGRPSQGKAQPLDSKIKTKKGWKTFRDIQTGDKIASIDKKESIVTGVYSQGIRNIYKITFSDDRSCEVSDEHLWQIYYRDWEKPKVVTTLKLKEMLTKKRYKKRLWIDICSGDFGSDKELPIDPYVLGCLLGDGSLSNNFNITIPDKEILIKFKKRLGTKYKLNHIKKYDYRIRQKESRYQKGQNGVRKNDLKEKLRRLGLLCRSEKKFIPNEYKLSNKENRKLVLMGLLDTDGWVEKDGSVLFGSVSERLVDDVIEIARSLGSWASKRFKKTTHQDFYITGISHKNKSKFISLKRKKERTKKQIRVKKPVIKSVEYIGSKKCACISTSHPSSLYITDNYIITHNTTLGMNIAKNAAQHGYHGLIYSLEMSQYRLGVRMIASGSQIHMTKIAKGEITQNEYIKINETVPIGYGNLYIDFSKGITDLEVEQKIREFIETSRVDFIVLDYLQKIRFSGRERRDIEVGNAASRFKDIAGELGIPFILISQLNRANEKEGKVRLPRMSDLRDSGVIEQEADVIIFIHRPEVYDKENLSLKNIARIDIAKNRDEEPGTFKMTFRGHLNRFENYIENQDTP